MEIPERPELNSSISREEFLRWYWKGSELSEFARRLDISRSGPKVELTARIAAKLSGDTIPPASSRLDRSNRIQEPLAESTVIPRGQSCTQSIRRFLKDRIGERFSFDAPMRDFFHEGDGTKTLGDAVNHWHSTRSVDRKPIGEQFELNRFTRRWYEHNPGGSKEQLLIDWERYKATPVELRGKA